MLKKIVMIMLFCGFTANAFASNLSCPAASDWLHESGKLWVLSEKAQEAGWTAETNQSSHVIKSIATKMPQNTELEVRSFDEGTNANRNITCNYSNSRAIGYGIISAHNKRLIDIRALMILEQFKRVVPEGPTASYYSCMTTLKNIAVCDLPLLEN